MLNRWIVHLVLMFIAKEIAEFRERNDWSALRAKADARIRDLIPGTMFDDQAAALVQGLIDGAEFVFGQHGFLGDTISTLDGGDFQGAIEAIKRLLVGSWIPADYAGRRAVKALLA